MKKIEINYSINTFFTQYFAIQYFKKYCTINRNLFHTTKQNTKLYVVYNTNLVLIL